MIDYYQAAMTMRRSGGSFAAAIAEAYFYADSVNSAILVQAFADLFQRFASVQTNPGQ